jgi:hypothetical protein
MRRKAVPQRFRAAAFLLLLTSGCADEGDQNMTVDQVGNQLAQMRIEPGLWDLRTEIVDVRGPDLPREVRNRMVGPRSQTRNCISPEQAARPEANFLAGSRERNCRYRLFSVRDGRVDGEMSCGDAEARMNGRFGSQAYDMRIEMDAPAPGGERMTLELRASGRRLGPCSEGESE